MWPSCLTSRKATSGCRANIMGKLSAQLAQKTETLVRRGTPEAHPAQHQRQIVPTPGLRSVKDGHVRACTNRPTRKKQFALADAQYKRINRDQGACPTPGRILFLTPPTHLRRRALWMEPYPNWPQHRNSQSWGTWVGRLAESNSPETVPCLTSQVKLMSDWPDLTADSARSINVSINEDNSLPRGKADASVMADFGQTDFGQF